MTGMKDTDYTFAVARVRANETRLLTSAELSSLTSAPGYAECARRLREKGYEIEGADYNAALEKKLADMWALISDVMPDPSQFNSILIKNDFHNLKVSVKALFTEKDPAPLFARPCVYAPEEIRANVFARENAKLPVELQHADRSAYRILSKTGFAQLADTVIDRASMEHAISIAKTADHPILLQLAETDAALTGIKVLYRCIRAGKAKSFMERAVCVCDAYDKKDIVAAADEGAEAFLEFVRHTDYAPGADALLESPAAYEKYADDVRIGLLSAGKSDPFGIAALVGYYHAVRAEVLDLRILLSGKLNGLPDDTVRERMRRLYV